MMTLLSYAAVALTLLVGLPVVIFTALTGVPTLSSGDAEASEVIALLNQANLARSAVIVDLGSGWGALVVAVAHRRSTDVCIRSGWPSDLLCVKKRATHDHAMERRDQRDISTAEQAIVEDKRCHDHPAGAFIG